MASLVNSTKHLKNKSSQFFIISLRKQKQHEHFPNSFYKTSDAQIPKWTKTLQEKKTTNQYLW